LTAGMMWSKGQKWSPSSIYWAPEEGYYGAKSSQRLFQQFTILKCAILATVTVVMILVHPGLLASPVEKTSI